MKTVQTPQDGAELARGPSTGLWSPGGRCKRGIDRVDLDNAVISSNITKRVNSIYINRQVDRLIAHGVTDLFDDTIRTFRIFQSNEKNNTVRKLTDGVNLTSFDSLEARFVIVGIIRWAGKCCPNGAVLSIRDKLGSKYSKERLRKGESWGEAIQNRNTCN